MIISILLILTLGFSAIASQSARVSQNGAEGTVSVNFVNNTCAVITVSLPVTSATRGVSQFIVESAVGYYNDDFQQTAIIRRDEISYGITSTLGSHSICSLLPNTAYSMRAVPYVSSGRWYKTQRVLFMTLPNPFNNYWESIVPRRQSLSGIGRGFTDSAVDFPNLDVGVEVYSQGTTPASRSTHNIRYSDPSTTGRPTAPSGRKGHTLSSHGGKVYMFGGRSTGYSCAYSYMDILNLGSPQSGRDLAPCEFYQAEVQELWELDVVTYEWVLLSKSISALQDGFNFKAYNLTPSAREQHAAVIVNDFVYIFGGKSDIYVSANTTLDSMSHLSSTFFNDLWRLKLPSTNSFSLNYACSAGTMDASSNQCAETIPQDKLLYLTINGSQHDVLTEGTGRSPRQGKCIDSIRVRVTTSHTCVNQLKIFLYGPGDLTGSANYQPSSSDHGVILFDTPETNGTGCSSGVHDFTFLDSSPRLSYDCCTQVFNGSYRPNGHINEFLGYSTSANWTLVVQDTVQGPHKGTVLSWGLDFNVSDCVFQYEWENVTASYPPSPRYHVSSLLYGNSIFYFGGRDSYDTRLSDLFRFDTVTLVWTQLTPISFDDAIFDASRVGCSLILSPEGLVRVGGYVRSTIRGAPTEQYTTNISLLDPDTLKWRELLIDGWDNYDGSGNANYPPPRYLSAATFIPKGIVSIPGLPSDIDNSKALFVNKSDSSHANFIGTVADSVFIFGGSNGAVGSTADGSDIGLLSDSWMLRLSNFSTSLSTADQLLRNQRACAWRFLPSVVPYTTPKSLDNCLGGMNSLCTMREMILLSWCAANYQALS